jgi:aryl-alcohol dehydrogenase-like predicted oxidoreductase
VKNSLAYTLRRLGTDHVDIYRPARLDPAVPVEETIGAIAEAKGIETSQAAIAWVLSRGQDVVPLIGARRVHQMTSAIAAVDLELTAEDLTAIEQAVPAGAAAGGRYADVFLANLDSEK